MKSLRIPFTLLMLAFAPLAWSQAKPQTANVEQQMSADEFKQLGNPKILLVDSCRLRPIHRKVLDIRRPCGEKILIRITQINRFMRSESETVEDFLNPLAVRFALAHIMVGHEIVSRDLKMPE